MEKIMIVDDDPGIRAVLRILLEVEGYDVVEIESGLDCLEKLIGGERPDLILLDVMMPKMDGWTISRMIKRDESLKAIPICMLTAKTTTMDALMSLESSHANWHLNKPIGKKHLLEVVDTLLDDPNRNQLDGAIPNYVIH